MNVIGKQENNSSGTLFCELFSNGWPSSNDCEDYMTFFNLATLVFEMVKGLIV